MNHTMKALPGYAAGMPFNATAYGPEVARILSLDGAGKRLMPLAAGTCSSAEARRLLEGARAEILFEGARSPQGALAGLYLYFSCLEDCHRVAQDLASAEGSFWHGIMHRQEPDPGNAAYWFGRVGTHPVFPKLLEAALAAEFPFATEWDPLAFIDYCERARRAPGSAHERIALRVQLAEWQLLFDWCALSQ